MLKSNPLIALDLIRQLKEILLRNETIAPLSELPPLMLWPTSALIAALPKFQEGSHEWLEIAEHLDCRLPGAP